MNKTHVTVSVIVPVFNDAERIGVLLQALLSQTYPRDRYEIIVVDNGSNDETPQVVEGFRKENERLISVFEERDIRGSYAARNAGIKNARGDILAFTDSDCVPMGNWIEAGAKGLEERSRQLGGGQIVFTYEKNRPNIFEYFDSARKLNQEAYVEKAGFAATANLFAAKQVFEEHGLFRADLVSSGDFEFCRRVVSQGVQLTYIADAVVEHPARPSLRAIFNKSKRIARGQKQIEALGIVEPFRLDLRKLFHRGYPIDEQWSGSLSFLEKLQLIALENIVRWTNMLIRIG